MSNQPVQTQTASFTVKYVNPPKAGFSTGSLKDTQGNVFYNVHQGDLARVQQGNALVVEYHVSPNGYNTVDRIVTINGAQPVPAPPPTAGQAAPPLSAAPQMPGTAGYDERHPPPAGTGQPVTPAQETPPILSNALGHYLANPNCRFVPESPQEFGEMVRKVQQGYWGE